MTDTLIKSPNTAAPDDLYEQLLELHRDLNPEESQAVNARLILLLANHIGDPDVLSEAIELAKNRSE